LTGTSTIAVNENYSAFQTVTGTLSGSPGIILKQGVVAATRQNKSSSLKETTVRIPITLDHEGLQRDLGRLTLIAQGVGGTSVTYATFNWIEIR
jgi:hypothetical protein